MLFIKSFLPAAMLLAFASSCHRVTPTDIAPARTADQRIGSQRTPADSSVEIRIYQTSTRGFGYSVYQGGRKVIDQPYIPAVQRLVPFDSEEEAKRVAQLVSSKLQAHQFPPSVTIRELDSLRIHY